MDVSEFLPLMMFAVLAVLLFSGYPVAFVLGGIGLTFGFIGMAMGEFHFVLFGVIPSRVFGGIAESLILTAIPMFIFMGTMLEKSGAARDLLNCLQVLLRRVPGGLALSVTLMGTIMAATTGIIGASVVMMTLLSLPVMLERKYDVPLATGTIAASGTLGILIPPSIMLVIMADLLGRSVGNLFVAAIFPGLILASFYVVYIITRCTINPKLAPKPESDFGPDTLGGILVMVLRSFIPPIFLIMAVLGSILMGIATPTEAAGVGAAGSILLAIINLIIIPAFGGKPMDFTHSAGADVFNDTSTGKGLLADFRHFWEVLKEVIERTALTNGMLFGIFIGATLFSFVFRTLGGDDLVIELVEALGFGSWGLLFLIMGIVFFLGFFFDWIEITLIVLPVFSPIIELMDFGTHVEQLEIVYWFAIMLAVNLQTSFLTPPFGFALFYMKAVAPRGVKIQQIYKGIIPFVMIQLVGLGLVMAFPEIALWLPRQLLN